MDALDKAAYQNIQTAFSAQTSANQIQDLIDAKLDKRRKVSWEAGLATSSVSNALCYRHQQLRIALAQWAVVFN